MHISHECPISFASTKHMSHGILFSYITLDASHSTTIFFSEIWKLRSPINVHLSRFQCQIKAKFNNKCNFLCYDILDGQRAIYSDVLCLT